MEKKTDLYDADELYSFIETVATRNQMEQTLLALPLMKSLHEGQFRRGKDKKPYIVHPLMIAKHALLLGLSDDILIAAVLLHDVIEDCNITADALPVCESVRKIVQLVTFAERPAMTEEESKKVYFEGIAQNKEAAILKVLDRCNNVSSMGETFSEKKLLEYIEETEKYVLPLIEKIIIGAPEYRNAALLSQYQIVSIIKTIERFVNRY